MGTLSANTLFHFTKTKENLISILQNGFYPRYSLENIIFPGNPRVAFPMVCFCDIPLSQIQNHSGTYGEYALGLTKEWAKKNGLCPVLYTHRNSILFKSIERYDACLSKYYLSEDKKENDNVEKLVNHLFSIILFMKPYEGSEEDNTPIRYYDEREWRYSIDLQDKSSLVDFFLEENVFINSEKRDSANEKILKYKLDFEPKDINYIIVPTDRDILNIRDEIKDAKLRFPDDDVRLLTTRIISMERIKEDF